MPSKRQTAFEMIIVGVICLIVFLCLLATCPSFHH